MAARYTRANSNYFTVGSTWTHGTFTFSCWFYPLDVTNEQVLWGVFEDSTHYYKLIIDGTNLVFRCRNGGGAKSCTVGTLSANTWYHGAAQWNGDTNRKVWLNGTTSDGSTQNVNHLDGTRSDNFGGWSGGDHFDGFMMWPSLCLAQDSSVGAPDLLSLVAGTNPRELFYAADMIVYDDHIKAASAGDITLMGDLVAQSGTWPAVGFRDGPGFPPIYCGA